MSSVLDIMVVAILLFAIGVSVLLIVDLTHRVNSKLLVTPVINSSVDAVEVVGNTEAAVNSTDYIYLALFVAFFIGIMITGYLVGGHPIFAPIYFFVVIVFTFIAVILQLVWGDLSLQPEFLGAGLNMPLTLFILSNLGYITAVTGLLGILAMFAKPQSPGGVG